MKLVWTSRSKADLIEIGRFIARDKPEAARRWLERIRQRARDRVHVPFAGRKVPEVERDDVREVFLNNYRIGVQRRAATCRGLAELQGRT